MDINDINVNDKINITKNILIDTGIHHEKIANMITVYNKIDINGIDSLSQYKKNYISALTGRGLTDLKNALRNSFI